MDMNFGVNRTCVEVIKKGTFRGTYFKKIYSGVNGKWYRKSWKEFNELVDIDHKYFFSSYYDVSVNKYDVRCWTSLILWKNNALINSINSYGWLQWCFRYWLVGRSSDDKKNINKWKKIVTRFKSKSIKMIKNVHRKLDGYSLWLKIGQTLLH